jgi:hypothetical protein
MPPVGGGLEPLVHDWGRDVWPIGERYFFASIYGKRRNVLYRRTLIFTLFDSQLLGFRRTF